MTEQLDVARARAADSLTGKSFLNAMNEIFPDWQANISEEGMTVQPEQLASLCQLFYVHALNIHIEDSALFSKHQDEFT